jgi:hypothetical protein
VDDFGNSINSYAFLTREMTWNRIYFFTSATCGGAHVEPIDNGI